MKHLILVFLFIGLLDSLSAQITGKASTTDSLPVSAASVSILKMEDSLVVMNARSDANGNFRLDNITPGMYRLQITSIGYQAWHSLLFEISAAAGYKDFGRVILTEDKKNLGEVVVRAEKKIYQQSPEGTIVLVENSLLSKGSSALEALERSPGVVINQHDNSIALNGKNGVRIMINGKALQLSLEQLIVLLSGISANNIERIELLTTPGVNYDAEGSAGIINIVLKKNKRIGTNGLVSLTAGYGRKEKGTGSVSFSHNTGKTSVYGSYTFSHDNNPGDFNAHGSEIVPVLGGAATFDFANQTKRTTNNHNGTVGIDSKLNDKTTVGGSINYNTSRSIGTANNNTLYTVLPDSALYFAGRIDGTTRWRNTISSAYLEKKMKEGEKIGIDVNYLHYHTNSPTDVESSFINKHGDTAGTNDQLQFAPLQKGFSSTTIQVGVFKMDYTKELNTKIKLETGIKATYTASTSMSGIESLVNGEWINRNGTNNEIDMNERVTAGYASVTAQLNESIRIVAGARYEHAYTHIENGKADSNTLERKLGKLFPAFFLTKKINDNSELQFSYTKRITRPSYNDLTSFIAYNDAVSVFTGNPLLKPTITNNLKMGYSYRNYAFSILLSKDDYPILQGQLTPNADRSLVYISPQNATYEKKISLDFNIPVKISEQWNMVYHFTGGWRKYRLDYLLAPFEKSYFAYSANFTQSFKFSNSFSAELSGWYNSPQYGGNAWLSGFGAINLGVKKELKNNAGSLQLSVTDILMTSGLNIKVGYNTDDAFLTRAHIRFNPESVRFPIIKLSYIKSFGSAVKTQRKLIAGDEESERIRKN